MTSAMLFTLGALFVCAEISLVTRALHCYGAGFLVAGSLNIYFGDSYHFGFQALTVLVAGSLIMYVMRFRQKTSSEDALTDGRFSVGCIISDSPRKPQVEVDGRLWLVTNPEVIRGYELKKGDSVLVSDFANDTALISLAPSKGKPGESRAPAS